jgi:hypothetical protein
MDMLARDPHLRFVGYGLLHGRAGGTMKNVPAHTLTETPTAENLLAGIGIGLSLRGLKPLLYFERADFFWNASDAILNHLAAMKTLSHGEFAPTCIIRVTIGNKTKPLFTGPVHTADPTKVLRSLLNPWGIPVHRLDDPTGAGILGIYSDALMELRDHSTVILEKKDWF